MDKLIGFLRVKILEARSLPNKRGADGFTDTVCLLSYLSQLERTESVRHNVNPKWGEIFQFTVPEPVDLSSELVIAVKDDRSKTKWGTVTVTLTEIQDGVARVDWYPVLPKKKKKKKAMRKDSDISVGQLRMCLQYISPDSVFLYNIGITDGALHGQLDSLDQGGIFFEGGDPTKVQTPEESRFQPRTASLKVVKEILVSERIYVTRIQALVDVYIDPLRALIESGKPLFKAPEIEVVFGNIENILAHNKMLHAKLVDALEARSVEMAVADAFLEMTPHFGLYGEYINNYNQALTMLSKLKTKSNVEEFFDNCSRQPECDNQDIQSLLIMPVQRIPRYELLLKDLITKFTQQAGGEDHSSSPQLRTIHELQDAHDAVIELADMINTNKGKADNLRQILSIQNRMSGMSEPLIQPHRTFIRSGVLWKKPSMSILGHQNSGKDRRRVFFLFSDVLIYAKKSKFSDALVYKGTIPLRHASVTSMPDTKAIKNIFRISSKKSYTIYADSPRSKHSWIADINAAIVQPTRPRSSTLPERKKLRRVQTSPGHLNSQQGGSGAGAGGGAGSSNGATPVSGSGAEGNAGTTTITTTTTTTTTTAAATTAATTESNTTTTTGASGASGTLPNRTRPRQYLVRRGTVSGGSTHHSPLRSSPLAARPTNSPTLEHNLTSSSLPPTGKEGEEEGGGVIPPPPSSDGSVSRKREGSAEAALLLLNALPTPPRHHPRRRASLPDQRRPRYLAELGNEVYDDDNNNIDDDDNDGVLTRTSSSPQPGSVPTVGAAAGVTGRQAPHSSGAGTDTVSEGGGRHVGRRRPRSLSSSMEANDFSFVSEGSIESGSDSGSVGGYTDIEHGARVLPETRQALGARPGSSLALTSPATSQEYSEQQQQQQQQQQQGNGGMKQRGPPPEKGASRRLDFSTEPQALRAVVIHSYQVAGDGQGQLPLRQGDIVYILRYDEEGWNYGVCENKYGFFPASYVQEDPPR